MNLEELKKKRREWVQSTKENGFEDGIRRLLTEIYPDNAHFLYELLQNAEDTKATTVRFTLQEDSVEFEHDGERLFTFKDVDSITSIASSTKRDDPTQIGQFGVGFKAVFAYTATPEIHSGEYHFRIHDLVVPEAIVKTQDRPTRFNFPFDHPEKSPLQAVEEIQRGLRVLGENTLLFLNHIRHLEYLLCDGALGSLQRIDHEDGHIEIRRRQPSGEESYSRWLRFYDDVEVENKTCRIAVAYRLEERSDKTKGRPAWKIAPADPGEVSIYFPAEKETSKLRFHIHAPFASTVARDSVRDCEANHALRDHIARLVARSLAAIRDQGLLTMEFLAILPQSGDSLSPFYEPIRQAIVKAFQNGEFTPTKQGRHAKAETLYRAPARIVEVLSDEDLRLLTQDYAAAWAANPPQRNQREDRFLDDLGIRKWEWSDLISLLELDDDDECKQVEHWVATKADSWLMRFYALLGEALEQDDVALPDYLSFGSLNMGIVRVSKINEDLHVVPDAAFFPADDEAESPRDIYLVKPEVYATGTERQKKHARFFLEKIGVRPYDEKAAIERTLRTYENPPDRANEKYLKEIRRFVAYWKKHPTDAGTFRSHAFLLGMNAMSNDAPIWLQPSKLCLDTPYVDSGLASLSGIHKKYCLSDEYERKFKKAELSEFLNFMKALGVMYALEVQKSDLGILGNPRQAQLEHDYWNSRARRTDSSVDEDYTIVNVEKYLEARSIDASCLIWHALIEARKEATTARYRPNQSHQLREAPSQLVHHLRENAWIPDQDGTFHKPDVMTRDALRQDFPFDDRAGLLTAIGFGEHARKQSEAYRARDEHVKAMGFDSVEDAESFAKVKASGVSPQEILSWVAERQRTTQPEAAVQNPERRRQGVLERRDNAPSRESIQRERTIQPGVKDEVVQAKAYLRTKYTNPQGQLVCQCCHAEMPFKIHDSHYFEAIQFVRGLDHHYFENRLALCPTCAAMYQHARETDDDAMRQAVITNPTPERAPSVEIPVRLAGKEYQLHLVGQHWFDLKTVLSSPADSKGG